MTNNTIPNVPRELLESLIEQHITAHGCTTETARRAQLLLSAPSPAGVDGLEVVAVLLAAPADDRKMDAVVVRTKNYADGSQVAGRIAQQLCRLSDAQAIIDGLRGEADQQAQRIAELASHLEFAVTMLTVAGLAGNAQVEAMRSALSAGVGRVK